MYPYMRMLTSLWKFTMYWHLEHLAGGKYWHAFYSLHIW